ncbi:hypothetical protein BHE74_00042263 [Ensete ventricosum]|nr:hypothetical protein BHE74_00042263 [Ensete ventricosum]RZS16555.1 hypothetical protein BHM03_00048561 [Ensete ventricosum]
MRLLPLIPRRSVCESIYGGVMAVGACPVVVNPLYLDDTNRSSSGGKETASPHRSLRNNACTRSCDGP